METMCTLLNCVSEREMSQVDSRAELKLSCEIHFIGSDDVPLLLVCALDDGEETRAVAPRNGTTCRLQSGKEFSSQSVW